jgi:AcrR family transcriptional regulator
MKKIKLEVRKKPVQSRSKNLNEFILQGATRVLKKYGANGFTTNKVAEETGISIGSFYQYYPNKESLLFELHKIETEKTWAAMKQILEDEAFAEKERLNFVIRYFFETESEEKELRKSLNSAAVFFQKTQEFKGIEHDIFQYLRTFLEKLPIEKASLDKSTDIFITLVKSLAEEVSERNLSAKELEDWSDICSKMLFCYLKV